jgi:hypothetical protein
MDGSTESITSGTVSRISGRNAYQGSGGDVASSVSDDAISNSFGGASLPFGISPRGNFLTLAEAERLQQPFPHPNIPHTSHGSRHDPMDYAPIAATPHPNSGSSSYSMQGNGHGASGGGSAAPWGSAAPPGLERSPMHGSQFNGFYGLPPHLVTALLASSNYSGNSPSSGATSGAPADPRASSSGYNSSSAFPAGSNVVLPPWPHGHIDYRGGGFDGSASGMNPPPRTTAAAGARTGATTETRPPHSTTQTVLPAEWQASRGANGMRVGGAGASLSSAEGTAEINQIEHHHLLSHVTRPAQFELSQHRLPITNFF